jgi:hypothetical protein
MVKKRTATKYLLLILLGILLLSGCESSNYADNYTIIRRGKHVFVIHKKVCEEKVRDFLSFYASAANTFYRQFIEGFDLEEKEMIVVIAKDFKKVMRPDFLRWLNSVENYADLELIRSGYAVEKNIKDVNNLGGFYLELTKVIGLNDEKDYDHYDLSTFFIGELNHYLLCYGKPLLTGEEYDKSMYVDEMISNFYGIIYLEESNTFTHKDIADLYPVLLEIFPEIGYAFPVELVGINNFSMDDMCAEILLFAFWLNNTEEKTEIFKKMISYLYSEEYTSFDDAFQKFYGKSLEELRISWIEDENKYAVFQ